jgi:PAS domain S-box-containing protein/putative nucleotidyltransferase with HDIG domain
MTKTTTSRTQSKLRAENEELRAQLDEAKEALRAIRSGEVDGFVVPGAGGEQLFTLKGADRSYRMLIEEMNEGALTLSAEGLILYANRGLAEMLKTPLEKVIGSAINTWIAPDSQPILQSLLRKGVDEKRSEQLVLTASDGTPVPVYLSVSNLLIDGMPDSFCLVATDLTEQKRSDDFQASEKLVRELLAASNQSRLALLSMLEDQKRSEKELRESEDKYRGLVTEISDGIFITDNRGAITFANPALARIHGFDHPDQMLGRTFQEFIAPAMLNEVGRYFQQVVEGEPPQVALNTEIVRPDGTHAVIEVVASVEQSGGKAVRTHGVVRDITERKQREEQIQSRTDELSTLYQLSRDLADANDLENVIELVNRHTVESVHTTFACTALLEEGELVPRAVYPVRSMEHDFIIGDRQPITALPVCQRVLEKNEPFILQAGNPEAGSAERTTLMLDFAESVCLVPLRVADASQVSSPALGLLILGEEREEKREPFTPEKIRLARSLGDQAASAIHRLLLREQARRRLQQLASLSEIDRTIASNFDLRLSLQIVLRHVSEQLEVDAADVLVFNEHLQTLEFAAGHGFRSTIVESKRLRLGEGQAGRVALERHIVQIPDVAASGAVFAYPELIKAEGVTAYFAVPLITKGKVKGVLEIFQRSPLEPNDEWLDFLSTLAGQAAIAIDVVQMFEGLQRSTDELELAYDATIEGWSYALDLRDKETEGHTQRVTEKTVKLARLFGLSEADLVQVRWGALLHDIGKMGVPDGILLKPGPLTDEEWVAMKKHPVFAYQMLSPIHYLKAALDIPYCHHEKWDGTGYPRGLKGEQIPLTARIFAVEDVWDALTSDRPYRQAWSEEKARQHIQAEAGTHFDPQVVLKFFLEHG